MKTITKKLCIGTNDMELYVDASIDGKKILDKKSDSLVGQFAKILYGCMQPTAMAFHRHIETVSAVSITNNGGLIQVVVPSGYYPNNSDTVVIGGALGCTEANGTWAITVVGGYTFTLNGSTFTHTYTGGAVVGFFKTDNLVPTAQCFNNAGMQVGTGSTPVTISDFNLAIPIVNGSSIGQLTYNTYTTSQDTNDSTSAQVTMTQTFTNNSVGDVGVNEIGLFMSFDYISYGWYNTLVARDIVAGGINVASGKTLTINYRIKTILATTGDTGGFVASFMRLLYSQISQTTRSLYDITNTSITTSYSAVNFLVSSSGGPGITTRYNSLNTLKNENLGIQVGSGSNAVSMGDYALQSKIPHGLSIGQLLYHGTFLDDYTEADPTATFTINGIFENQSGGDVTINEIGVYAGAAGQSIYVTDVPAYAACIIHNKLATPITLPTNEILKVVYTIEVIA